MVPNASDKENAKENRNPRIKPVNREIARNRKNRVSNENQQEET